MIPPSPSLSARMISVTYLIETISVIDQKIERDDAVDVGLVGVTAPSSIVKTVCSAYSGLVPMSPKTTPSAASVSATLPAS